ncbi:MAG: replication factor C large subunit [Candidatus Asgardarchaeia archaeon]
MVLPWTIKYRPRRISQVVGNTKAISQFVSWLETWLSGRIPKKRAIILNGPPGTGKTASVYAAAEEYNLEVIELNVSDRRDAETLKQIVGSAAALSTLTGTRLRIILLDEIDGISAQADRGGLKELLKIIDSSLNPIVMTANNIWDPKFRQLREKCEIINFNRLTNKMVLGVLKKICEAEGIDIELPALEKIAENSGGDLRAAINDLQAICQGRTKVTLNDLLLSKRDRELNIFETLSSIFYSKSIERAVSAVTSSEVDYELLMRWISENIPRYYKRNDEIADAFDMLSKASIFLSRAKYKQYWRLLVYVFNLMSAGVNVAKRSPIKGFVKSSFPSWIKKQMLAQEKRRMLLEIGKIVKRYAHLSANRAIYEVLPYLAIIAANDKHIEDLLIKKWDLKPEMIKVMKETFL